MQPDTELEVKCSFCGADDPQTIIIGFPACYTCKADYAVNPAPYEHKITESF